MSNWYNGQPLPSVKSMLSPSGAPLPPHFMIVPEQSIFSPPYVPPTAASRRRRKSRKDDDVSYPINYGIYNVPDTLSIPDDQQPLVPNEIKTLRYATGIDDRNFITVYEYSIGDQSIIWDYFTGYVHLTGIWKALGNSKADIVRLLDGSPELEQVFKRVRGGFLKIQGTWVPFEVARALSLRFSWPIRYALVPMFGPDFPSQCLQPHEQGYGQLQMRAPTATTAKTRNRSLSDKKVESPNAKSRTQSAPHRRRLWDASAIGGGDECAIDSSDEDEGPNSPPPMPRKLSFVDAQSVLASPPQFLEMLQATRSLQQLSSGELWSSSSLGGDFEVEGSEKRYVWDGENRLDVA